MLCNSLDDINRALAEDSSEKTNAKAKPAATRPTRPAFSPAPDLPSDDNAEDDLPALEMPEDNLEWDWGSGSSECESETKTPEPKRPRGDETTIPKSLAFNFGLLSRAVLTGHAHMSHQLVSEVFSPPRVTVAAQKAGYEADFAFDLVYNAWDAMKPEMKSQLKDMLRIMKPAMLVLSPPCTMFSALTRCGASLAGFGFGNAIQTRHVVPRPLRVSGFYGPLLLVLPPLILLSLSFSLPVILLSDSLQSALTT